MRLSFASIIIPDILEPIEDSYLSIDNKTIVIHFKETVKYSINCKQ